MNTFTKTAILSGAITLSVFVATSAFGDAMSAAEQAQHGPAGTYVSDEENQSTILMKNGAYYPGVVGVTSTHEFTVETQYGLIVFQYNSTPNDQQVYHRAGVGDDRYMVLSQPDGVLVTPDFGYIPETDRITITVRPYTGF